MKTGRQTTGMLFAKYSCHPPMLGRVKALRREIFRKVHQVGVRGTLKHIVVKTFQYLRQARSPERQLPDPFDSMYGTDTAEIVPVGALDIPERRLTHANRYEPVALQDFDIALKEVPVRYEEYVFVDMGCGKGRALLLASRRPFKRIIGVELSVSLTKVAAENIRIYRDEMQRCREIEVLCQDASNYELPKDKIVLHLYNPFGSEIMRAVVVLHYS